MELSAFSAFPGQSAKWVLLWLSPFPTHLPLDGPGLLTWSWTWTALDSSLLRQQRPLEE